MDSVYDRLGDLLKETLEAGSVKFVKMEIEKSKQEQNFTDDIQENNNIDKIKSGADKKKSQDSSSSTFNEFVVRGKSSGPEYHRPESTGRIYHAEDVNQFYQREYKPQSFVYKALTPEVERAYRILDIPTSSAVEEIKKAYKEKIKYYHPDRYTTNPVLQKVATEKTRQLVEAFGIISAFLEI